MARVKIGLIPRIAIALGVVGLVPLLAASIPLVGLNRDALQEQVLKTHSMAARTAAGRVASLLSSLDSLAGSVASNPVLTEGPRSAVAQELLAGTLQARPDVAALALFNDGGELVIRAQRRGVAEGVERLLAAPVREKPTLVGGEDTRWLRLDRPLPAGGGTLRLLADPRLLEETVRSIELGEEEAELVLADTGGEVVAGDVATLAPFPPALVAAASSLRAAGAGAYAGPGGERILGAFAPVAGSDWFVVSRQPARIAEQVALSMRRRSYAAVGLALVLVVALSAVAHYSFVRPIRRLASAQRRLAGLTSEPRESNEIEQLRSSFRLLERRLHERDEIGKVFLGRYQVLELLGEGAMGSVFTGWDPKLERKVALKTVRFSDSQVSSTRRQLASQLLIEATTAARFSHPNIVAVYDVEDTPEVAFFAMEFVDGMGLDRLLWPGEKLDEEPTLALAFAVSRALAASHGHGIVHRDIKPSNVLLGYDGAIKVADFGIAAFLSSLSRESETVFGTPGYLAPEALRGDGYDARGDLFGLGVMLYECLTGRQPFKGRGLRETAIRTLQLQPEPLAQLRPDVSVDLAALVERLMHKDPADRPEHGGQVVEHLERLCVGRKIRWDPATLPRHREALGGGAPSHLQALPTLPGFRTPVRSSP